MLYFIKKSFIKIVSTILYYFLECKIEMENFDISLLKAEDEFSKATDEEVLSYLRK